MILTVFVSFFLTAPKSSLNYSIGWSGFIILEYLFSIRSHLHDGIFYFLNFGHGVDDETGNSIQAHRFPGDGTYSLLADEARGACELRLFLIVAAALAVRATCDTFGQSLATVIADGALSAPIMLAAGRSFLAAFVAERIAILVMIADGKCRTKSFLPARNTDKAARRKSAVGFLDALIAVRAPLRTLAAWISISAT
mmetsp:Transcript_8072/g.17444  ORF Transcript_8072/g.17444 Transcript_8072/m.17444 type:complete len:197 (+) Transcript_8072:167-757(+)